MVHQPIKNEQVKMSNQNDEATESFENSTTTALKSDSEVSASNGLKLNSKLLLKFGIAKSTLHFEDGGAITDNGQQSQQKSKTSNDYGCVNSMDFYSDGLHLVVAYQPDDQIVVFDCETGEQSRLVKSQKYGVDLIRFTHARNGVIHSSSSKSSKEAGLAGGNKTKENAIRYLSLHDNKYIRYFEGHNDRVTNLTMSPTDDTFISACASSEVRLWDLRDPKCTALMDESGSSPIVAFDPDGLVFAIGMHSKEIKLYDLRSFDSGPFATFILPAEQPSPSPSPTKHMNHPLPDQNWSNMSFSPDGKHILLECRNTNYVRLVDAFYGKPSPHPFYTGMLSPSIPVTTPTSPNSNNDEQQNSMPRMDFVSSAAFSSDSQFLLAGSSHSGRIYVWQTEDGSKVGILNNNYLASETSPKECGPPIRCLAFNPSHLMLATGSDHLNFWLPNFDNDEGQ